MMYSDKNGKRTTKRNKSQCGLSTRPSRKSGSGKESRKPY